MTYKYKTLFWLLLTASASPLLEAQEACCEPAQEASSCCSSHTLVEAKVGYFFFSDSTMRKVYNKGGIDVQLCASYPLWEMDNNWTLNVYGAVEYFYLSGKSINENQHTSIWSIPINLGVKPIYTIDENTQYYFAIGPRYSYIQQHNSSPFVYRNRSKNTLGFFVNTGFNYTTYDGWIIDIFGEYTYAKAHFHSGNANIFTRNIQVGGFTFGGGLGYEF